MNKYIEKLYFENKKLKLEIKDATYDFEKRLKENHLIINCLKELSELFGPDSIVYNIGNGVNSDSELLKDYKLNIPVNTNGVKYKLSDYADFISYIFYYNIKGKLILVEEYSIYEDNCHWLEYNNFERELNANIYDYSIFSTRKVIENKIIKRINYSLNKIIDYCVKNNIAIGSENCPKIKFSGYNEKFFSDYQEEYFKKIALFL